MQENLERFPFPNEDKEFSLPPSFLDESIGEAEGTDDHTSGSGNKKSRSHNSSSLSPASSPISKPGNKRKRN